jgi:hypothetical protein
MKEILEIRLPEAWAKQHLPEDFGKGIVANPGFPPLTRQIIVESSDPRVKMLQQKVLSYEKWHSALACFPDVKYHYNPDELKRASLFRLRITCFARTYGEQWGTIYDEQSACPKCGLGRRQVSPLILDPAGLPKRTDLAVTVTADEWLVSERLADLMTKENIVGGELVPIQPTRASTASLKYQLKVKQAVWKAVPPTRFAQDYFHEDMLGQYICPEHLLAGLNLVSELYVVSDEPSTLDISLTKDRVGQKNGYIVPAPFIIISPRFAGILSEHNIKGYTLEIAHSLIQ